MQHVGMQRRKAGLIRRRPIVRYSLEVLDTFSVDVSAPNSMTTPSAHGSGNGGDATRLDSTSLAEELRVDSAAARAPAPEMLSFDRFGVDLFDPFTRYPFKLDTRARELMCTGLSLPTRSTSRKHHIDLFCSLRGELWPSVSL
jgi:hypothetical protein